MRVKLALLFLSLASVCSAQVWEKPVAPGLTYRMEVDATAPRIIHALRWSLNAPEVAAVVELAGKTINEDGTVKGRATPAKMASDSGALAAINGDFFSFNHGAPIGTMIRNGELITTPFKARATFGWGKSVRAGLPVWSGSVSNDSTQIALDHVNQVAAPNQVSLFTSTAGIISTPADGLAVQLKVDGPLRPNQASTATVDYIISEPKKIQVQPGMMILVARGNKSPLIAALRPKNELKIEVKATGFDFQGIEHALGGGPFLIRSGITGVDAEAQGFNAAFRARHPRTAVGRTPQGDLWFVAIDGRQGMSIGATLDETAVIMQKLGCIDAINLDGGGSTALSILGVTVNRPSDKAERPVSNAILFFGPRVQALEPSYTLQPPAKLVVGETFQFKLMNGDTEVSHSDILWSAQGAAWIDQGGLLRAHEAGKATVKASVMGSVITLDLTVEPPPAKDRL